VLIELGGSRILLWNQVHLSPVARVRAPGNSPTGAHLSGMARAHCSRLHVQVFRVELSAHRRLIVSVASLHRRRSVQREEVDDATVAVLWGGSREPGQPVDRVSEEGDWAGEPGNIDGI